MEEDTPVEFVDGGDEYDPEIAQLVGHVVLESAMLDYWLCHLLAKVLGDDDQTWKRYWGQSGEPLIAGLKLPAERDARLPQLIDPVRSVVQRRHQVVHGLWFLDIEGPPGSYEAVRPLRKIVGDSDDQEITLDDLHSLRRDIRRVSNFALVAWDSMNPQYQYGTGEEIKGPDRTRLGLPSLKGITPPTK